MPSHRGCAADLEPLQAPRETRKFWDDWVSRCTYQGTYRDAVIRSLITLKALTYAPTGGIVAAPTTSLPEDIGGVRNWDYRYCWLRDATLPWRPCCAPGTPTRPSAWRAGWAAPSPGTRRTSRSCTAWPANAGSTEWEAAWLPGYESSAPVRIGNAAAASCQLDVYGEVIDALTLSRRPGCTTTSTPGRCSARCSLPGEALGRARRGYLGGARARGGTSSTPR